jgi:hypothetical protein
VKIGFSCHTLTIRLGLGSVTPPKLASANPVESLAIHPDWLTCNQLGDRPCKIVKVSAREGE